MNTTLIQALRADARAKLAAIHSWRDLEQAVAVLTEAIEALRTPPEDRSLEAPTGEPDRRLAADLLMIEAARADLAARLEVHGRALEAGLFGAPPAGAPA